MSWKGEERNRIHVNERNPRGTVRLLGAEMKEEDFKFLGSTVQSKGECGKDDRARWRKMIYCGDP